MANEIGAFLRKIRESKKMTQDEVVERMSKIKGGIRFRPSLSQMEHGRWRPTPSKLDALSHGYDLAHEERTRLETLLRSAVIERRRRRIEISNAPNKPLEINSQNTNEALLVTQLLQLSKEARERVIRTIRAFDK